VIGTVKKTVGNLFKWRNKKNYHSSLGSCD
jgi:hypothetical protein